MKKLVCLALLCGATVLQVALAADWKMDPAASRLAFAATFEGASAPGVFKDFDVRLAFDPERPAGGRLDVTIRIASADMASADINKAIAGAEWFDFAKFPQAEFHATEIRSLQPGRYAARGTLTLKGVAQPVDVPFTWLPDGDGATMEGEFVTRRTPFGIGTGEWARVDVIGAAVTVKFRVRLRRAG